MTIRAAASTLFFAVSVCVAAATTSVGQLRDRSLPSQNYYAGFAAYYAADYGDALKHFVRGGDTAFKIGPEERFMDSACYWTMAGECWYQMGNYAEALAYYEQSLELLLTYASGDWQLRIDPRPNSIQRSTSAVQRAAVNWFQSTRGDSIANVPGSFSMQFGRLDAARAIVEGGVVQTPEIRAVDHAEIMRCVALAIHRRNSIKGITNQIDPFTARLISGLGKLPTNIPVLGNWNQIVIGLANMGAGRNEQAASKITSGLKINNGLDHQLTPIGLLALARIAFESGEANLASQLALEASHSAAVFNQFDLVEEALSLGNQLHLAESRSVYPPLEMAIGWASANKARMMQTSLILSLADGLIESDNADLAAETLAQTRRTFSGTDLGRSPLAAKALYLSAAIEFMNSQDGFPQFSRAMAEFQTGSRWLFQLGLVNSALASGSITQRQAELAYEQLLVDPSAGHWKLNPMETMAYLTSDHVPSMEAWFEILLARKNSEKAIEVSESIRRHRFFSSLPMSGRLLALRWILTAPESTLTAEAIVQRNEIHGRYPKLKESIDRVGQIENELRTLPLNPPDKTDEQKRQLDLFVEQSKHSKYQEKVFAGLALRRQPADFVFPAATTFSDISRGLGPRQVIIASLRTASGYHQFTLTQQSRRYLGVVRERDMQRASAKLYKSMGITDAGNSIDADVLNQEEWKAAGSELKNLIFGDFHDDQWENFDELVVVPDGLLWYVPFEILQTGADEADWKNLNESVKIRYLPVVSMVTNSRRTARPDSRMAVVTGKIHPKAIPELADRGFEKLTDQITNAVQFSRPVKVPSNLLTTVIDNLVVWTDLPTEARDGPYSLMPFQLDKGRDGAMLGDWINAPWQGPENIVLPMFSSGSAAGIKARSDGSDLFLTSCGLLASGVRSALISRWRTGGENSLELTREFAIRSRRQSTPQALYESCKFSRNLDLNLENEIRIKPTRQQADTFKAEHPFFWAGFMLIDLAGHESADASGDPVVIDANDGDNAPDPGLDDDPDAAADPKDKDDDPAPGNSDDSGGKPKKSADVPSSAGENSKQGKDDNDHSKDKDDDGDKG